MPDPRLVLSAIEKSFGPNRVLRGIDLEIGAGEVLALMGANGAGKSTLVRLIGGVHVPDGGRMALDGAAFAPTSPAEAIRAGIVTVHQAIDDGVIPSMTVLENLVIDRLCEPGSGLLARPGRLRPVAEAVAARAGLDLPLEAPVAGLSLAERQLLAVARALAREPRVLILDEPTSALSESEAERLFGLVDRLRSQGVAVLYISHRMGDIRRIADRIVTLRDGAVTGDFRPPFDYAAAVHAMLGQAVEAAGHAVKAPGAPVLALRGLRLADAGPPIDLDLFEGQVTAAVGLVGAGKTELAECLYGLRTPASGTMRLAGEAFAPGSPGDAVGQGVFMAAEDRAGGSIVPGFDVARTMSLPFTRHFSRMGFLARGRERANATARIEELGIVCRGGEDPIEALSGGNQQKAVLGRWLTRPCRLLILDEPFQGVDIKARRDIGQKLRETAAGRATLILCADLDEALEAADRVLVMSHAAIVGDYAVDRLDRDAVVRDMAAVTDIRRSPHGG